MSGFAAQGVCFQTCLHSMDSKTCCFLCLPSSIYRYIISPGIWKFKYLSPFKHSSTPQSELLYVGWTKIFICQGIDTLPRYGKIGMSLLGQCISVLNNFDLRKAAHKVSAPVLQLYTSKDPFALELLKFLVFCSMT